MRATTPRFDPHAFALLAELEANNTREWYAAHRDAIARELLEPCVTILETATRRLARTAVPFAGGKKTMFRLHRDTRFSVNKLPYKTNVGGLLTPDGTKKSMCDGLVYLHCEADGGFVAAGFYMPGTAWLEPLRRRMLDESALWRRVLRGLDKAGLALDAEHRLKAMPRGFADAADHEHAESLKLKSLIVSRPLGKQAWTGGEVVDECVALAKDARALLEFGRGAG